MDTARDQHGRGGIQVELRVNNDVIAGTSLEPRLSLTAMEKNQGVVYFSMAGR